MPSELWKEIPGFAGYYEASTLGNLRRLFRISKHGSRKLAAPEPVSAHIASNGYLRTCLTWKGKAKNFAVHRLILSTFSGEPKLGQCARHLNGIRIDNRIENLSWRTKIENEADKLLHGTRARGNTCGRSKLDEQNVRGMLELRKRGLSYRKIAEIYKIAPETARRAIVGINWAHLAENDRLRGTK